MAVTFHELSPADCPRPMTAAIRDEIDDLRVGCGLVWRSRGPRGEALTATEMLGASGEGVPSSLDRAPDVCDYRRRG